MELTYSLQLVYFFHGNITGHVANMFYYLTLKKDWEIQN